MQSPDLLAEIDDLPWDRIVHVYGRATEIPTLIRPERPFLSAQAKGLGIVGSRPGRRTDPARSFIPQGSTCVNGPFRASKLRSIVTLTHL